MQTACREYTQPRYLKTSRPRLWIRSNTKVGPVLDVKIYHHEGRRDIDIMIETLLKDQTVSWVRIVNGIKKYVTETSEEIPIENVQLFISTRRRVAKAKSRPKFVMNWSSNHVPIKERIWTDTNPKPFNQCSFAVSKFRIRLLRHDASIPREDDGAVRFDDLIEKLKVKFVGTLQWTVDNWENCQAKKGGEKFKDIQEVILLIHHCKTLYCSWRTLPNTSVTSGTLSKCTPLSIVD